MKTNYKLYIFIAFIIVLGGAFLYYFLGTSSGYTLNIKETLTVDGQKVVFKAKANPLEMELNDPNIFSGEKGVAKEVNSEVIITIEADKKVNCTYDLIYSHDDDYIRYNKTLSSDNEFTVSYDNSGEKQIENFGNDFVIGNYSISGPTSEESKKISLKFYRLDEDQMVHVNTVYRGNLQISNIECH